MDPENTGNDFDAEIDAILNGGDAAATATPTPKVEQTNKVVESAKLKAGGREWDSPDSLAKAYDSLLKDYSRKGDELKKGERYIKWGQAVEKHQDLRSQIEKAISDYNAKAAQGRQQSPANTAQLPPE